MLSYNSVQQFHHKTVAKNTTQFRGGPTQNRAAPLKTVSLSNYSFAMNTIRVSLSGFTP